MKIMYLLFFGSNNVIDKSNQNNKNTYKNQNTTVHLIITITDLPSWQYQNSYKQPSLNVWVNGIIQTQSPLNLYTRIPLKQFDDELLQKHEKHQVLWVGKTFQVIGNIKQIHDMTDEKWVFGMFHRQKWLQQHQADGVLEIIKITPITPINSFTPIKKQANENNENFFSNFSFFSFFSSFSLSITQFREKLRLDLWHYVPESLNEIRQKTFFPEQINSQYQANERYTGILIALFLGDQSSIHKQDWQLFHHLGIGHLLSVSGGHITIIAMILSMILSQLIRGRLLYICPRMVWQRYLMVIVAFGYSLLTGFSIPAQRTCVMLLIPLFSLYFPLRWFWVWLWTLLLLVVTFGFSTLTSPSFWLSFGAVFILSFFHELKTKLIEVQQRLNTSVNKPILKLIFKVFSILFYLLLFCSPSLCLLALQLILFPYVNLLSLLFNAIAIPLIGLLIVPLLIFAGFNGILFGVQNTLFLWQLPSFLLMNLLQLCVKIQQVLTVWLLSFQTSELSFFALKPILYHQDYNYFNNSNNLNNLNYLNYKNQIITIPTKKPSYLMGNTLYLNAKTEEINQMIIPYLLHYSIKELEMVIIPQGIQGDAMMAWLELLRQHVHFQVISFSQNFHLMMGGYENTTVIKHEKWWQQTLFYGGLLSLNQSNKNIKNIKNHKVIRCQAGQSWQDKDKKWSFMVLHPHITYIRKSDANANSCVIQATNLINPSEKKLITGNIGQAEKESLTRRYGIDF